METWSAFSFWRSPRSVRDFGRRLPHQPKTSSFSYNLEKINLDLHQLRQSCPKHRLLKGLNQNGLSEIVQLNIKSLSEAAHKFLLPQTITPHVYEGKCPDIRKVIHKTSPIPGPIAPVNQSHPVWQFD